jgi:hypothetical protein
LIRQIFAFLWRYCDLICFLAAIGFAVWGFFLLSFVAGIFSVAVGLVAIGYLAEKAASLQ